MTNPKSDNMTEPNHTVTCKAEKNNCSSPTRRTEVWLGIDIPRMESAQEVAFNGDRAPAAAAADYESAGKSLFMCEHARAKQGADCSATGEKMEVSGKRGGRGRGADPSGHLSKGSGDGAAADDISDGQRCEACDKQTSE